MEIASELQPRIAEEKKAHRLATLKRGTEVPDNQNFGYRETDHHNRATDAEVAKAAGVSRETYRIAPLRRYWGWREAPPP